MLRYAAVVKHLEEGWGEPTPVVGALLKSLSFLLREHCGELQALAPRALLQGRTAETQPAPVLTAIPWHPCPWDNSISKLKVCMCRPWSFILLPTYL